ncbi:glycerol kinase GlpK [Chlorobium sp. KB01]|uniref:glycerol kinase GlpK n=1 Tax=Chlorobium sp. KB01 TaxID=1917528 RepID=UPI00097804BD|nr:glycerol kinase GlpK [Chlorobium sp. KB01]
MAILAIDQGTTGTTCILYNHEGEPVARAYREFSQIYPHEGWVEHDPEEIWQSVVSGVRELKAGSDVPVTAIGITNQRETTIVWDRVSGRPLYNAIVWQCRRTSELCRNYEAEREMITAKTGLPLDAYFSATKIRWILDHCPHPDLDTLLFGTVDTWLLWKLTGGRVHATDFTNASRTLLYNIREKQWDTELLDLFGIPLSLLPEVKNSMDDFGKVTALEELNDSAIAAVAGDQQAALFGQCCFQPGSIKNTYGTGCFMVMNTGDTCIRSEHGLLTTLALGADGKPCYALEGSVFIGGAVIQWLRDELQLLLDAGESEAMARDAGDNGGVYIVPAFVGLGAPHWQMEARGTIAGLTRGSNRNHIVRAALESIAYQSYDVFRAMVADSGFSPEALMVDGGAVSNGFLMQFQADLLDVPILVPINAESTSLGAAYLAGLQSGVWRSGDELMKLHQAARTYLPDMAPQERCQLLSGWQRAVRQTLAL